MNVVFEDDKKLNFQNSNLGSKDFVISRFLVNKGIVKDIKKADLVSAITLLVLTVTSLFFVFRTSLFEDTSLGVPYNDLTPGEKAQVPAQVREISENLLNQKK